MKSTILSLTSAAVLASAQIHQDIPPTSYDEGYYSYYGFYDTYSPSAPVANTSSRWALWSYDPNPAIWTWNVNIREIISFNESAPNATEVETTYSLSWPEGVDGNLNAQLEAANDAGHLHAEEFCVTVVQSLFPENTTNGYNPEGRDGASCGTGFFECYNALLAAWIPSERNETTGCLGQGVDPTTLPACRGTWDTYNVVSHNLWNDNVTNGDTFFYRASEAYTAGNTTYLEAEENRLHMIILDYGGYSGAVCAKASTTNASLETGGVDDPATGGASLARRDIWLAALTGISAVFALL